MCFMFIDIILSSMINAIGFGMVDVDHLTRKKIFNLASTDF